jgi:hypothetical protein
MEEDNMENKDSVDILYDIATSQLKSQIHRIDGADAKIGIIFGLTNGLAAALGGCVVLNQNTTNWIVFVAVALSGLAYFIIMIQLYFAYRWGKWSFRPEIQRLRDICTSLKYRSYPNVVKEWIADESILSINTNKGPLSRKVAIANDALKVLAAQGLFLVLAYVLLYLLSGSPAPA